MSIKPDKLLQHILDLQKFVSERAEESTSQISVYQSVGQRLEGLKTDLESKPIVQIVGEDFAQAQALRKLLKVSAGVEAIYQLKVAELPKLPEPHQAETPTLVLEITSAEKRYLLSTQSQILGRHPEAHLRLPDTLILVSGRHAELRPLEFGQLNSNGIGWEICDLKSRNGTYVNGERVQTCRVLASGDLIGLGSPVSTQTSATFRFEQPEAATLPTLQDPAYELFFNGDILCLVIDPQQPLSLTAQHFLLQAQQVSVKRVIVAAMPAETSESLQTQLAGLVDWLNNQSITAELVPLLLHNATTANETVLSPQAQPEFEQFCHGLENAAASQLDMPTARISDCLNRQVCQIKQALVAEIEALEQPLQPGLDVRSSDALKEKVQKAITEVREDKEKVFKQIKQELTQARAGILDSFSRKSILHQIQTFTDGLNPIVLKEGHYRRIHLQNGPNSRDVQQQIHDLCRIVLVDWAKTEWQKANVRHDGNGLEELKRRIQNTLSQVSLSELDWGQKTEQHFNPQRILDNSMVEPNFETRYRGDSMKDYFMKQMRAPLMQFTFLSGAVLGLGTFFIGFLRSILGNGVDASSSNSTTVVNPFSRSLQAIPAEFKSPMAFSIIFICITLLMYFFYSLYINYQREEEFKREDAIAKVKKELSNYYQSLAKSLVEKLSQHLNLMLETEEQLLSKQIDYVFEQLKGQAVEIKGQIEDRSKQQKKLNEAKIKLEKLKG